MNAIKVIKWLLASIAVLIVIFFAFVLVNMSGILIPNPRMPEIKYAEFPLRIEIEYKSERFIFEDTIVCEYEGVGVQEYGTGKYRRWKEYFASGNEYQASYPTIILLDTDVVEIKYHSGEGAYYMDKPYYEIEDRGRFDKDNDGTPYTPSGPHIYIHDKRGGTPTNETSLSFTFISTIPQQEPHLRETLEKYGVELINMEQTQPIENTFR